MSDSVGIRMNARVQLRRDAKSQRPQERSGSNDREKTTRDRAVSHRSRASTSPANCATDFSNRRISGYSIVPSLSRRGSGATECPGRSANRERFRERSARSAPRRSNRGLSYSSTNRRDSSSIPVYPMKVPTRLRQALALNRFPSLLGNSRLLCPDRRRARVVYSKESDLGPK